jgi:putative ABC transport system permease protein
MHRWLEDFANWININIWVFIASKLIAIMIALATIDLQIVKAALANPVKSLRAE